MKTYYFILCFFLILFVSCKKKDAMDAIDNNRKGIILNITNCNFYLVDNSYTIAVVSGSTNADSLVIPTMGPWEVQTYTKLSLNAYKTFTSDTVELNYIEYAHPITTTSVAETSLTSSIIAYKGSDTIHASLHYIAR